MDFRDILDDAFTRVVDDLDRVLDGLGDLVGRLV